ncbi:MAG TPA: hypothetical protein VFF06_33085 [Polyangia bacterium]|nr:hypothetical protein [Polyangia bacterium]
MSGDPVCLEGGYIAGARVPLPDDPRVYYLRSNEPVACNRLYCDRCRIFVRAFSGYRLKWPADHGINSIELYDAVDPAQSRFLQRRDGTEWFRAYCCRHATDETAGFNDADGRDAGWRCAGHPTPA